MSEEIRLSDAVRKAMESMSLVDDPLCRVDLDLTAYINTLFPTEQSLSHLDDTMETIQKEIIDLDAQMADLVESHSCSGRDGHAALMEAKAGMLELMEKIKAIEQKTENSESMVAEMTRDIKQLDVTKRNLTESILTLHHLHILLAGLESLGGWIDRRQYAAIGAQLPAMLDVLHMFESYHAVPQVKQLADQVDELKQKLSVQVTADFKQSFTSGFVYSTTNDIGDICRVISVLEPTVKADLTKWFIDQQLSEYFVLYADSEDLAWIDRIDMRYRWFVTKLTDFEKSGTHNVFPADWDIGRRLTIAFCTATRDMLDRLMQRRSGELDWKLLTHAINHTCMFENMLCRRFPTRSDTKNELDTIIWCVFEKHMHVFVAAQDKNFTDFIEQCASRIRSREERPMRETSTQAYPLPSSADMFLFFKRTIKEATKLSTDPNTLLVSLIPVFRKCLRGYAHGCLTAFLPKVSTSGAHGTVGLFQTLLKEGGEVPRLTRDDQFLTCCILATADWCAETTQQLQEKLRERVPTLDMTPEMDVFYGIAQNALNLLAQDLEYAYDAALQVMTKINWSCVESVGDESAYVASVRNHLRQHVPLIRDFLSDRRKYFAHFCLRLSSQFVTKYLGALFRCRPVSVSGAEQLLLDAHALKTFVLNLPNIESTIAAKPPTSYTTMITKMMAKAEMILKIVMSDLESPELFVQNYAKLLPESDASEFQKVLEMKAIRRLEQAPLLQLYRNRVEGGNNATIAAQSSVIASLADNIGDSNMRRLERLVKKKL